MTELPNISDLVFFISLLGVGFIFILLIHNASVIDEQKNEIRYLTDKIYQVEKDALVSISMLSKEHYDSLSSEKQKVDLLTKEMKLLFKQNKDCLALGLTSNSEFIRELASNIMREES